MEKYKKELYKPILKVVNLKTVKVIEKIGLLRDSHSENQFKDPERERELYILRTDA